MKKLGIHMHSLHKKIFLLFFLSSIFFVEILFCFDHKKTDISATYIKLNPKSLSQLIAFSRLYPHCKEAKDSLNQALKLLQSKINLEMADAFFFESVDSHKLIDVLRLRLSSKKLSSFSKKELLLIETLCQTLGNRKLKGYHIENVQDIIDLPDQEIDLARAILLCQKEVDPSLNIVAYESILDLMALEILLSLGENPSEKEKIQAINKYIFFESSFRFPPLSKYSKAIDYYTFLPSVMDAQEGVCLGISILYLSLAQRLNLQLEAVTPPGHIFLSTTSLSPLDINIETTSRGIHVETLDYYGVNTRSLQKRSLKDVLGLAHMNRAAVYWEMNQSQEALKSYQKALVFLPKDPQLKEFLAYQYLFLSQVDQCRKLLKEVESLPENHLHSRRTIPRDFLDGKADMLGIQTIFSPVDETPESLSKKRDKLLETIKRTPHFREAYFQIANIYLQLSQNKQARQFLEQYHAISPYNIQVEYYLSRLYFLEMNYIMAWKHLKGAKKLLNDSTNPKVLKDLEKTLKLYFPDPQAIAR